MGAGQCEAADVQGVAKWYDLRAGAEGSVCRHKRAAVRKASGPSPQNRLQIARNSCGGCIIVSAVLKLGRRAYARVDFVPNTQ